jgi:hypothetical protein
MLQIYANIYINATMLHKYFLLSCSSVLAVCLSDLEEICVIFVTQKRISSKYDIPNEDRF